MTSLTELLFSRYRRKLLGLLLLRPDQSFHVRELARLAALPPGTLHRELRQLAEAGLLLSERLGNQVRYRANRDCPIFPELASIFRKTSGLADVLREALLPVAASVEVAFVFGSVAQGKEQVGSDIDLCLIGTADFAEVVQALAGAQEGLGREVNPLVLTRGRLAAKVAAADRFTLRMLAEPKIFLLGGADDLGEFTGDRPA